jgi:hypothetical protein
MTTRGHDINSQFIGHQLVYNSFATTEFRETIGSDQEIKKRDLDKRLVNETVDVAVFRVVLRFRRFGQEVCDGSDLSDNQPLCSPGAKVIFDGERVFRHVFNKPMGVEFGAYFLAGVCHLSSLVLDLAGVYCVRFLFRHSNCPYN